jgi:hypothetical protein
VHTFRVLGGACPSARSATTISKPPSPWCWGFSRARVETARWTAFHSLYDFEPFYCRPGIEGEVDSLAELNAMVGDISRMRTAGSGAGSGTVGEHLALKRRPGGRTGQFRGDVRPPVRYCSTDVPPDGRVLLVDIGVDVQAGGHIVAACSRSLGEMVDELRQEPLRQRTVPRPSRACRPGEGASRSRARRSLLHEDPRGAEDAEERLRLPDRAEARSRSGDGDRRRGQSCEIPIEGGRLDRIEADPRGGLSCSCFAVGNDRNAFWYDKAANRIEYRPTDQDEVVKYLAAKA